MIDSPPFLRILWPVVGAWLFVTGLYAAGVAPPLLLSSTIASATALLSALVLAWIVDPYLRVRPADRRRLEAESRPPAGESTSPSPLRLNWPVSLGIVVANALLGIGVGIYVADRLVFPGVEADLDGLRTLFIGSIATNVIVTQVGGWAFQSFLTFLMTTLLDGRGTPRFYFQLVGTAYLGYLGLTLFLGAYNAAVLPAEATVEQIEAVGREHHFDVYSKSGEYLVLALVTGGIFLRERFGLFRSAICATTPSLLLLIFTGLFGWLFSS